MPKNPIFIPNFGCFQILKTLNISLSLVKLIRLFSIQNWGKTQINNIMEKKKPTQQRGKLDTQNPYLICLKILI